jgi:3-hydroxyisobutyrate dehydrogenase-like beta-hydroxyacid dehydrogenase
MAKVAFLGTGLMGSGMVEAALRRGDEVRAWNRTLDRARPLEKLGARILGTAADAASGAERVHLVLGDDAAVDAVLEQARSGIGREALVVDHSTVSPAGTVARFRACEERGIAFLHAPVFMGPQQCREAKGLMLCAGPGPRFARAEPALRAMTGDLWHVGERPDLAAAYKLFGNALLLTLVGGLSDVYQIAGRLGIAATEAHQLFSRFKPGGTIDTRGKNMAEGNFKASFELCMARKDVRLMLEAAGGLPLTLLPALAARMDEVLAQGRGSEDVGVLAFDRRR